MSEGTSPDQLIWGDGCGDAAFCTQISLSRSHTLTHSHTHTLTHTHTHRDLVGRVHHRALGIALL